MFLLIQRWIFQQWFSHRWMYERWISHRSRCDYPRSEYAKQIREQRAAPHRTSQVMPTTLWYSGFTPGFKTSIKPRPFTVWRELHFYISGAELQSVSALKAQWSQLHIDFTEHLTIILHPQILRPKVLHRKIAWFARFFCHYLRA